MGKGGVLGGSDVRGKGMKEVLAEVSHAQDYQKARIVYADGGIGGGKTDTR